MTMATKKDIFKEHLKEWLVLRGDKKKRGELAGRIASIAKVHPKSVARSFRRAQMRDLSKQEGRGRKVVYGKDVDAALYDIWDAASRPCGELLHAMIGEYADALIRDDLWKHGEEATALLRQMGEITVRRKAAGFRIKHGSFFGRSTTKTSELKHIIPIFKGPWEGLPPGEGQLDTVAHCGGSIKGDYAFTVNYTDAALYWGVRRAQWNKGQAATVDNLESIRATLPFPWTMGHPDTGSEFINWVAKGWAEEKGVRLTRSEPGKKNDNMYVEERNGHVVRKHLGWDRLDRREVVPLMNEFYLSLDLYLNHFQAVRRTLTKERAGAKYKRTFEKKAKTPYLRLMEHPAIPDAVKERVRAEHEQLNPLLLKRKIDSLKGKIFTIQKPRGHDAGI